MKRHLAHSSLSGRAKAKALAGGAGTLIDLGGRSFRTSEVLPKYSPNDPFSADMKSLGADFARVFSHSKAEANRR